MAFEFIRDGIKQATSQMADRARAMDPEVRRASFTEAMRPAVRSTVETTGMLTKALVDEDGKMSKWNEYRQAAKALGVDTPTFTLVDFSDLPVPENAPFHHLVMTSPGHVAIYRTEQDADPLEFIYQNPAMMRDDIKKRTAIEIQTALAESRDIPKPELPPEIFQLHEGLTSTQSIDQDVFVRVIQGQCAFLLPSLEPQILQMLVAKAQPMLDKEEGIITLLEEVKRNLHLEENLTQAGVIESVQNSFEKWASDNDIVIRPTEPQPYPARGELSQP